MRRFLPLLVLAAVITISPVWIHGQRPTAPSPITYRVSFLEAEHHWMQVEVIWTNLGSQPFETRMSRSSPGRYAVAEFAKNIFSVEAFDGKGQKLATTRPDADVWRIAGHDGTVCRWRRGLSRCH